MALKWKETYGQEERVKQENRRNNAEKNNLEQNLVTNYNSRLCSQQYWGLLNDPAVIYLQYTKRMERNKV